MRLRYQWEFSRLLNIRPWEIGLLSVAQFDEAVQIVDRRRTAETNSTADLDDD